MGACRDAPGGKGLSRVDSMALAANAKSMARMHDSGRVVDPNRDISHHYRPHRGYSGSHHDGGLYAAEVGGSLHAQQVGGSMHKKKSMPRNRSEGNLVRSSSQVMLMLTSDWLLIMHCGLLGDLIGQWLVAALDMHNVSGLQKGMQRALMAIL